MTIAVNISPIQFMHPGLVDDVEQLLAKFGLYPARLEFEIANDLLIRGAHQPLQVLRQLKRWSCLIAMDDVGAGH